jgi:acylpyruvate hydrolase
MKLVTINRQSEGRPGALLVNGSILDLQLAASVAIDADNSNITMPPNTIVGILAAQGLDNVQKIIDLVGEGDLDDTLTSRDALIDMATVSLLAPVPNPSLILAQSLAYREHLDEMGVPLPSEPSWLMKSPSSIIGPGQNIILPSSHPDMVDWEGEFTIVIGKQCHRVNTEEAMDYVAGYTIINDVSARDWTAAALNPDQTQMDAVMSWGKNVAGKQFPTFTPMGPVLVSADEISDPNSLALKTTVNGEVMQDNNTNDLIFPIDHIIAYFSQWYTFQPGDLISTGSPAGVGFGRDPKLFMKDGDVVEITVEGLGTLSNPVKLESKQ